MVTKPADTDTPVLHGLPPVAAPDARVLVLGSMPGKASLCAQHYYAHRTNRFWPVMAAVFPLAAAELLSLSFDDRYAALRACGVALWDTVGTCRRSGSLDSAIREAVPNDIAGFLSEHPQIMRVLLNGAKSAQMWDCYAAEAALVQRPALTVCRLPSTSPANAAWREAALIECWKKAVLG